MRRMIDLNSKQNKLNEASRMSFMDETKLKESIPSNDQVNSDLTWQDEANCMLLTNETKLRE